jgi:polysaccharide deacetylase
LFAETEKPCRLDSSGTRFVNEKRLYKQGQVDERIEALNLWLEDGFDLGNHTFAHTSLNRAPLQAWEEDVTRGETVTQMLLAEHKMKLRYFRHPYLDTVRALAGQCCVGRSSRSGGSEGQRTARPEPWVHSLRKTDREMAGQHAKLFDWA